MSLRLWCQNSRPEAHPAQGMAEALGTKGTYSHSRQWWTARRAPVSKLCDPSRFSRDFFQAFYLLLTHELED